MKCPYCGKEKVDLLPGKYTCTRCTGKFSIHNDLTVEKLYRSKAYTIASIGSIAITGIVIFILNKSIINEYELARWENVAGSVGVVGFIISELLRGVKMGILPGKGCAIYREDTPKSFLVLFIALALIGLASIIAGGLEAFDIVHLRQ